MEAGTYPIFVTQAGLAAASATTIRTVSGVLSVTAAAPTWARKATSSLMTRDAAARAEFDLVQNIIAEQALQAALQDGYLTWGGSPVTGPHLPHGLSEASQVEVIFRNGQRHTGSAQAFGWNHSGYNPHAQIVAYRVVDTTAHSHFAG